jgi:rubredoxin
MQCKNPNCNKYTELDHVLFGDNWTCPECGAVHETDWEYTGGTDDLSISQWTTELISVPESRENEDGQV